MASVSRGRNVVIKKPMPERGVKLRPYLSRRARAVTMVRSCQKLLVVAVASRLKRRYLYQMRLLRYLGAPVTFRGWLLDCRTLESTYSTRSFSYKTRHFWVSQLFREIDSITLGVRGSYDWFADALQVQLGLGEDVVVKIVPTELPLGALNDDYTLVFEVGPQDAA